MKFSKKVFLIISISFFGLIFNSIKAKPLNYSETTEVLLIGSSYFNYNNLASLIQNLADNSGKDLYIEMCGQNGLYLSDHASSSSTEAKINERDWDYVILQGVGILVAYPEHFTDHPVYPALVTLRDKIYANCETTRMVFCMPWAFEDGMTWYQDWTDTFADMQNHIYTNTLQYSDEIGFEIAPVGWAWYAVLEEYNYPLHYLHMSDWSHPNLKGSYLMACVIYSTVFHESTVDIPYYAGISESEATYFQSIASDIVLNNMELWNILLINSEIEETNYKLKCFPNPFNDSVEIFFSLNSESEVEISISDMNRKAILSNKLFIKPGIFSKKIDISNYADGIYFVSVSNVGRIQTQKLIKK